MLQLKVKDPVSAMTLMMVDEGISILALQYVDSFLNRSAGNDIKASVKRIENFNTGYPVVRRPNLHNSAKGLRQRTSAE